MKVSAFITVLALAYRRDQIKWTTRIVAKTVAVFTFSAAVAAQPLVWVSEGPSPTTLGQVEGIADGPVAGAIKAVAPHPNDANVIYIGAVNGGVWKTTDALSQRPHWQPLTDDQKSLSIGALAFDPTDSTYQTLVAGTGRFSSDGGVGSALIGLLRTTDGGASWTTVPATRPVSDANITSVVPRGDVIVISSDRGVFRLANGQWKKISGAADTGLPRGPAFDLVADPTNPARLFTNSGPKGIYRSDDAGATWTKVSDAALDALLLPCRNGEEDCTKNLRIAAGTANNVYVGIANGHAQSGLAGLFRSGDGGATWTALDLPQTVEAGGAVFGLYSEGQAEIDFSIAADPQNPNIVYVGGDAQPAFDETNPSPPRSGCGVRSGSWPNSIGACTYSGRLFRIDASLPPGSQATHITHSHTASGTAPHADSRNMTIDANGDLLEVDDGGIYRRTRPQANDGDWFAMDGDIQVTEFHSIAWDANFHRMIGGTQDTGTPEQFEGSEREWESVSVGDGGVVAVDDTSTPGVSYRYSSYYGLGDFRRQFFDTVTKRKLTVPVGLFAIGNGAALKPQFYTPIKLNEVDATRLIIGAANSVYESLDQGDTIEEIGPGIEVNGSAGNPIAYGGTGNPDMLYVGSGRKVYVRKKAAPAPLVAAESYPGSSYVVGIDIDPANPQAAFVIGASNVYLTKDAGATWATITGNLMTFDPVVLRSIAYATDVNGGSLFVGTNAGVFVAAAPDFSNWSRLGSGLPNAPVFRMEYNAADQILVAGTHGRGAWTLHFKNEP